MLRTNLARNTCLSFNVEKLSFVGFQSSNYRDPEITLLINTTSVLASLSNWGPSLFLFTSFNGGTASPFTVLLVLIINLPVNRQLIPLSRVLSRSEAPPSSFSPSLLFCSEEIVYRDLICYICHVLRAILPCVIAHSAGIPNPCSGADSPSPRREAQEQREGIKKLKWFTAPEDYQVDRAGVPALPQYRSWDK